MKLHKLLERQLKKLGLSPEVPPENHETWIKLLQKVSQFYEESDQERYLTERAIQISSREMQERWQLLEEERSKSYHAARLSTLGEMASGIAHEINNPLAMISYNSDMICEFLASEPIDKEMLRSTAAKIVTTGNRISKIISGLRSFARQGDQDPFTPTSVQQVVTDALDLYGGNLKTKNIILKIDIPHDLIFECRSTQISQVILNLCSNACDAIEGQSDAWLSINAENDGDFVKIRVIDSGPGIPKNIRDKIMQPFFTTKEIGKGTGLGLSISKGIVESHQGQLQLDENLANTCFVISIPKKHTIKT